MNKDEKTLLQSFIEAHAQNDVDIKNTLKHLTQRLKDIETLADTNTQKLTKLQSTIDVEFPAVTSGLETLCEELARPPQPIRARYDRGAPQPSTPEPSTPQPATQTRIPRSGGYASFFEFIRNAPKAPADWYPQSPFQASSKEFTRGCYSCSASMMEETELAAIQANEYPWAYYNPGDEQYAPRCWFRRQ